jgi:hypothetical protein|tara:strand:- start:331 stop:588 length:258 start_codon:yes stop_codon:yes gene_type:complete
MKKETIQEWIRNAETHEAIVYHTGHLIEERKDMNLTIKTDAFLLAAQEGKIELYQKKIKAGSEKKAPIYDYIARKLKTNEKSNNN